VSLTRAAVLPAPGRAVEMWDVSLAAPGPGEVEVEIAAAGVCGSDLHVVGGEWDVPMPVVLGHEGAGVVSRLGPDVTGLEVGDHVILSWVPQCGRCRQCEAGRPWQCELVASVVAPGGVLFDGTSRWSRDGETLHHYLGVSSFAERVVVPESGAVRIRPDAPLDVVAIVGCAVATGVGAVRNTAAVPPGASVAVIGCGGVGLSVIQGARLAGAARIVACDVDPGKLEVAAQLGATDTVVAGDPLPEGLDFVFDAIGKIETTEQAIGALGAGRRGGDRRPAADRDDRAL
jgi:S-(hydroxymethyl)glutathione dehydrogenase/alcohol dehydrogenase